MNQPATEEGLKAEFCRSIAEQQMRTDSTLPQAPFQAQKVSKQDLTQTSFRSVLIDDKYTICGLTMKPLSLGHIMLLEAINHPSVSQEEQFTTLDMDASFLFLALMICSLSYEDGLKLLNDETELNEGCQQFSNNIIKQMEADPGWNIPAKIALFKNYMSDYLQSMPYYEHKNNVRDAATPSGSDWRTSIFVIFKKLGYSQTEILNMSLKRLFMEWTAWAEGEGQIKICNKFEAQQLRQLEQFKRKG